MTTVLSSTIRPAVVGDLPAILDLYAQTGLDDGVRLPLATARDVFRAMAAYPYYQLFVATSADEQISATYCLLIMDNIAHGAAPLSIVEHVAVSPSH